MRNFPHNNFSFSTKDNPDYRLIGKVINYCTIGHFTNSEIQNCVIINLVYPEHNQIMLNEKEIINIESGDLIE